jgi:hypothetical protein
MQEREISSEAAPWQAKSTFPRKNNQSGGGSGMGNLGQWNLGLGGDGFGALSPCNYGGQEEADESADEKTNYEGNHFSFSLSK